MDSHPITRDGIEIVLRNAFANIDVLGTSDMAKAGNSCRLAKPDLVLMDLMLPGAAPLIEMRRILGELPDVKFVVFTALKSEARAADAIRHGASGYVLKWCQPDDMVRAVERALSGSIYIDPSLDEAKISSILDSRAPSGFADELTRREKQVLELIIDGARRREIASLLNISPRTVDCYRQRLMQKLGAHNVADVIHWSYKFSTPIRVR
nr:response regulator transcription factor [Burkholderia oklahomensis]